LKLISLWAPVVLIMGIIFAVSAMPDPGAPPGGLSDKSAHFLAYAALGGAFMRALASSRVSGVTRGRAVLAVVLTSLYGVFDEVHQHFVPGRTPDWADVAADAVGAIAGTLGMAGALWIYERIRVRVSARDAHG
jgi:VanZ family protein